MMKDSHLNNERFSTILFFMWMFNTNPLVLLIIYW